MTDSKQRNAQSELKRLFQTYSQFNINTLPVTSIRIDAKNLVSEFGGGVVKSAIPPLLTKSDHAINLIICDVIKSC